MGGPESKIICPKCGGTHVDVQVVQEDQGSVTRTKTKSKYKEKGHGIIWWLCIGWWWWFVDLCSWIFFFVPRLILRLFSAPFKKKKYVGQSTSQTFTKNNIVYRQMFVCKDCGHFWKK